MKVKWTGDARTHENDFVRGVTLTADPGSTFDVAEEVHDELVTKEGWVSMEPAKQQAANTDQKPANDGKGSDTSKS